MEKIIDFAIYGGITFLAFYGILNLVHFFRGKRDSFWK